MATTSFRSPMGSTKSIRFKEAYGAYFTPKAKSAKGPGLPPTSMPTPFFSDPTIPQFIPRLYLWLEWRLPSVYLSFHNAWNFRNQVLDFSNARCRWTINENIALSLETRYRSQYDWRKADHENFILDVTRSESQLLSSPLSDRRLTLLTDLFVRLSPFLGMPFSIPPWIPPRHRRPL